MLMGKVVSKKKYEYYEYFTALFICIGMAMFLVGSRDTAKNGKTTFQLNIFSMDLFSWVYVC